jgi:hypothetical protein
VFAPLMEAAWASVRTRDGFSRSRRQIRPVY